VKYRLAILTIVACAVGCQAPMLDVHTADAYARATMPKLATAEVKQPATMPVLHAGDMLYYWGGGLDAKTIKAGCEQYKCDRVQLAWDTWHAVPLTDLQKFAAAIAPIKIGLHFMSPETTWRHLLVIRQLGATDVYFDGMEGLGEPGADNLAAMSQFLSAAAPYCRGVEWIESSADTAGCEKWITAVGTTDTDCEHPAEWGNPPIRDVDPYRSVALLAARILAGQYPPTWAAFSRASLAWIKPYDIANTAERDKFIGYVRGVRDGLERGGRTVRIVYQASGPQLTAGQ
jgi:hypothetical protein